MIKIPLQYSDQVFAHALVDDDREYLIDLGYYSVTVPRPIRQLAPKRPDIILAYLREDESVRRKCRPFVSVVGTQVLLVHMVVRPMIARLILEGSLPTPHSRSKINEIRSGIGRLTYVNEDCLDCRTENLREVQ